MKQIGQASRGAIAGNVFVAVDSLAKQRDFFTALIGQDFGFVDNLFRIPALLWAACHRHDAVSAELITADLNSQKGLKRSWSHGRIA